MIGPLLVLAWVLANLAVIATVGSVQAGGFRIWLADEEAAAG